MPAQILAFLIAVFQLFSFGNGEHVLTQEAGRIHYNPSQHHIVFHNIAGEEIPDYALGWEEAEDTDDDSNETLKSILAASGKRRSFLPVTKHEYNAVAGASSFVAQTPLFVLHRKFLV